MSPTPEQPESEPVLPARGTGVDGHPDVTVKDVAAEEPPIALPQQHPPVKQALWKRWMAWSGSFFVLSLLLHVILIGAATLLVVQVVQSRKDKLKFTAPPPTSNPGAKSVEHKVKMAKKTASMSAPTVSKRITSTAPNTSIALPAVEMSGLAGPDVMASVMREMGSASMAAGASSASVSASASGSGMAGMTSFGFRGVGGPPGLVGHFYDLKQSNEFLPGTKKRLNTFIGDEGLYAKPGQYTGSASRNIDVLKQFFKAQWNESILRGKYFEAQDPLTAFQVFIPAIDAAQAPAAFSVEKEVKPSHWVIHYKGNVIAPRDGKFRFVGNADNLLAVRFDGKNVFVQSPHKELTASEFPGVTFEAKEGVAKGSWFQVERGKTYPIEILIAKIPQGLFSSLLMIEEENPMTPYPKRTFKPEFPAYPVFQVRKGMTVPPYEKPDTTPPPNARIDWEPAEKAPETAPAPLVFTATK
jgi:hypothetical protein